MATRRTISIDAADADQLYALFHTCEAADRHFHSCQGALFRQFVCESYKAENVSGAFGRLKARIDELNREETHDGDDER